MRSDVNVSGQPAELKVGMEYPVIRDIAVMLDDGLFEWNGSEVEPAAQAFIAYLAIKRDEATVVRRWLMNQAARLGDQPDFLSACYWLWIAGEYLIVKDDPDFKSSQHSLMDRLVRQIADQWQEPRLNWHYHSDPGLYTVNLAIAFGALQSIQHPYPQETVARLLIDLKNFLFSHCLYQGRVKSQVGNDEVTADIGLMAIPFGYLDAGNQILVTSVHLVEQDLSDQGIHFRKGDTYYGGCASPVLTSLLAWYYSERGDLDRARGLLSGLDPIWEAQGLLPELHLKSAWQPALTEYWLTKDPRPAQPSLLAAAFYALAEQSLKEKQAASTQTQAGLRFIHDPVGTGNLYRQERFERRPRYPAELEEVFVDLQVDPFRKGQTAKVIVRVQDRKPLEIPMQLQVHESGERFFQASIGAFRANASVTYSFVVEENGQVQESETWSFVTRRWLRLVPGTIQGQETGKSFQWLHSHPEWAGARLAISFEKVQPDTWKFTCSVMTLAEAQARESLLDEPVSRKASLLPEHSYDPVKRQLTLQDSELKHACRTFSLNQESFADLLLEGDRPCAIRLKWALTSDEQIYGLGERYSTIAFRGQTVDQYVFNQYRDQGLRTYMPVPLAISSKGYGLYVDTDLYSQFKLDQTVSNLMEMELSLEEDCPEVRQYLFFGSPAKIVAQYTEIAGKPVLPPKWAFGPWISSNNWDRQSEVMHQIALGEQLDIPATVIVLEQWSDEATFYIFNDAQYEATDGSSPLCLSEFKFPEWGRWPDPKKMVSDIHQAGLRVLLWQAPVLKYMDGIAHTQRDQDESFMIASRYCVMNETGEPYRVPSFEWFKNSVVPDFSNEQARDWWLSKRLYLVDEIGIDGFKTDGGECIYGEDTVFANGRSGTAMRNRYPLDYIGAYYDFVQQHVPGGGITFSRAGYAGIQKFPLVWAGDERSTYKAFRDSIRAGLNAGLCGIPFWGWDFAGFNGDIPSAELYVRAAQMAAFCPVMQYHAETKGAQNQDRTPWNIADRTGHPEIVDLYRSFANWRMNLLPYIYQQAQHSSQTGIPMMRAMVLSYPEDESCRLLDDQYLFGDSLLVAPLVQEQTSSRLVYLPDGKWTGLFDNLTYEGRSRIHCHAGWQTLPVFIRDGSVIPMNLGQNMALGSSVGNVLDHYQNLTFLIVTSKDLRYQFQDDLGSQVDLAVEIAGEAGQITIELNHHADQAIYVLLPVENEIESVTSEGVPVPEVAGLPELTQVQGCARALQGRKLAIRVPGGQTRLIIHLAKGTVE